MRKALSILLSVMLILSVLPLASYAVDTYDIWVAGTQVTSENAADLSVIDGVTGTVSFNPETNTLYLEDASIDGPSTSNYGNYVTVSVKDSFETINIDFSGTNTIGCDGNSSGLANALGGLYTAFIFNGADDSAVLNINARTTPTAENGALRVASVTVNGGTVICTAPEERYEGNGYQNNPYGVSLNSSSGDLLTVNGGKFICRGYAPVVAERLEGRVAEGTLIMGSANYDGSELEDYDYISNGFYDSNSHFQTTYRYVEAVKDNLESYSVFVAGTQVTSENAADLSVIDGVTGTVSFNPETNTLYLENASVINQLAGETGAGIKYLGTGTFTVNVTGTNTVSITENQTQSSSSIAIGNPGVYDTFTFPQSNLVINLTDGATLTATGGTAEGAYYPSSYGIVNAYEGDITVQGEGTLYAYGGKADYSYGILAGSGAINYVSDNIIVTAIGYDGVYFSCGMVADDVTVTGANVFGRGGNADTESGGVYAQGGWKAGHGFITVNGGSLKAVAGSASANSRGVLFEQMTINGGTVEAYGYTLALSNVPILGEGVTAGGSTDIDGSNAEEYVADNNSTYKWFCSPYTDDYKGFPDVKEGDWYYDAVKYCAKRGFIGGYANGKFGPSDALQRQDFVVILARIAGADVSSYTSCALTDVKMDQYYGPSVAWAVDKGIIKGYTNGKFGVGDKITREQVATILYRFMGAPEMDDAAAIIAKFPDAGRVSDFAVDAIAWANQNGIINGKKDGTLAPTATASRAEIVTIIMRMDRQGMFDA